MTAADVLLISVDLGETPAIMYLDRFLNRKTSGGICGIRFYLRLFHIIEGAWRIC